VDAKLKAYCNRWHAVAEVERLELQTASLELRWQQLNAVIGMAVGLGIFKPAEDEIEVFQRWAKLKGKTASQHPTA
jgi:hypothetical protein